MELLFTTKHLTAILIALIVIGTTLKVMNKYDLSGKNIIIYMAVVFYIFELCKQFYWIFTSQWEIQRLPFFPCNMPYYVFPFLLLGSERVQDFLKPFLYAILIGGGVLTLAYPSLILGTTSTWTFEMINFVPLMSVLAHSVMIGTGIYLLSSGYYKIRKYDYLRIFIVIFSMYMILYVFNQTFNTDFFFSNYGNGLPLFVQSIKNTSTLLFAIVVFLIGYSVLLTAYFIALIVNYIKEGEYSYKKI